MHGVRLFAVGSDTTRPIGVGTSTMTTVPIFTPIQFEDEVLASQIKQIFIWKSLGFHFMFLAK
jgi:hypothetical protein